LRSLGGIDYRLHLHGDGFQNALSGLWQPADSYLIEIGSDVEDPNSEASVPKWYFPLHTTNTWTLESTSSTTAGFSINHIPLNWPLAFPLHLVAPTIDVVYALDGHTPVTIASAHLKNPTNGQPIDLELLANTTDQTRYIQLNVVSDSTHGPAYCRAGLTYIDTSKCALSEVVQNVISNARFSLQLHFRYVLPSVLTDAAVAGQTVTGSFTLLINDNYWSREWSRIQDAFSLNEWALIPPGPPHGAEETFTFEAASSLTSLQAQIKLRLINPFNFPLHVERVSLMIAYEDSDGVGVGGSSWRVRTLATDPNTWGNMLSGSKIDEALTNFDLQPGVAKWSPLIGVPIGNLWENARRLYDEYSTKKRLCLHVREGLANAKLSASGSPFRFSIPFEVQEITVFGDNDCVAAPDCDIFSDSNANNGHYRTVFDYTSIDATADSAFTKSYAAAKVSNYFRLVYDDGERGGVFTNARYDMQDSFELSFGFAFQDGYDCGFWCTGAAGAADGFALVFQAGAASSIGDRYGEHDCVIVFIFFGCHFLLFWLFDLFSIGLIISFWILFSFLYCDSFLFFALLMLESCIFDLKRRHIFRSSQRRSGARVSKFPRQIFCRGGGFLRCRHGHEKRGLLPQWRKHGHDLCKPPVQWLHARQHHQGNGV